MSVKYFPLIQTRDSQLEALENLSDELLSQILPIFELTTSRRSAKANPTGRVDNNIRKIINIMFNKPFILDITTYPTLSNQEIDNFFTENNGFSSWVNFIENIRKEYQCNVIPCIVFNPYCLDDVKKQIDELLKICSYIAFRFTPNSEDNEQDESKFIDDVLRSIDPENRKRILLICDLKYIKNSNFNINVLKEYTDLKIIVIGSSYPKSFQGENSVLPEHMWNIKKLDNMYYGDYAGLHPILYDDKAYNWRARIDFVCKQGYIYHRYPKAPSAGKTDLQYIDLANKINHDKHYTILNCWGCDQIQEAYNGFPLQSSPRFWISVRMNIYMTFILTYKTDILNEMNDLDI